VNNSNEIVNTIYKKKEKRKVFSYNFKAILTCFHEFSGKLHKCFTLTVFANDFCCIEMNKMGDFSLKGECSIFK